MRRLSSYWRIILVLLPVFIVAGSRADTIADYRNLLGEYRQIQSIHFRTERRGFTEVGAPGNGAAIQGIYECWYVEPGWRALSHFTGDFKGGLNADSRFDGVITGMMDTSDRSLAITHNRSKFQPGVPLYDPLLMPLCPLAPPTPQSEMRSSFMWTDLKTPGLLDAQLDRLSPITGTPATEDGLALTNVFFLSVHGAFRIFFDDHALPTTIVFLADDGSEMLHASLWYEVFHHNGHILHLPTHSQLTVTGSKGIVLFKEDRYTKTVDLDIPVDRRQFTFDYQRAKEVWDRDSRTYIQSHRNIEAQASAATKEISPPPVTLAEASPKNEDISSLTLQGTIATAAAIAGLSIILLIALLIRAKWRLRK